jgi:hypothetical protein
MQTSWSTTVAPALRRSVRTLGYDVSVRSRTTSVRPESTAHGRWQRPACRIPCAASQSRNPIAARRCWRTRTCWLWVVSAPRVRWRRRAAACATGPTGAADVVPRGLLAWRGRHRPTVRVACVCHGWAGFPRQWQIPAAMRMLRRCSTVLPVGSSSSVCRLQARARVQASAVDSTDSRDAIARRQNMTPAMNRVPALTAGDGA